MPAAVDSNVLWILLDDEPALHAREQKVGQFWLPLPVLAEAWFTVLNSARQSENQVRLEAFVQRSRVPPMGPETALRYARIRMALRRKGRPIPQNDMWIAAVCLEYNLPLATRDAHFDEVEGLQVVRW